MNEVEIKLSKEQYKIFIKFLYFGDYCAWNPLISTFKDTDDKDKLVDVIEKIYKLGDKLNLPKSFSLTSMTHEVRFTEEESHKLQQQISVDLDNIAWLILAHEFAERDINRSTKEMCFDHEGGWLAKDSLITERMSPYLKEFKENGISNLRFKMFYHLPYEEDDE